MPTKRQILSGQLALTKAAAAGDIKTIERLVSLGIDPRFENNSVLLAAARCGHINIIKFLFEKVGVTIADLRANGNQVLLSACHCNNIILVRYLFEKVGLTLEDARVSNNKPLRFAIDGSRWRRQKYTVARYLVENVGISMADATFIGEYDLLVSLGVRFDMKGEIQQEESNGRELIEFDFFQLFQDARPEVKDLGVEVDWTCPICFNALLVYRHYGSGVEATVEAVVLSRTVCGHVFHGECLSLVMTSTFAKNCPICRKMIIQSGDVNVITIMQDTRVTECIQRIWEI